MSRWWWSSRDGGGLGGGSDTDCLSQLSLPSTSHVINVEFSLASPSIVTQHTQPQPPPPPRDAR